MEQNKSSSAVQAGEAGGAQEEVRVTKPMRNGEVSGDLANSVVMKLCTIRRLRQRETEPLVVMKLCTIRRLRQRETEPLGFEMTKRGTQAHYISRIEPGSSAAVSGNWDELFVIFEWVFKNTIT